MFPYMYKIKKIYTRSNFRFSSIILHEWSLSEIALDGIQLFSAFFLSFIAVLKSALQRPRPGFGFYPDTVWNILEKTTEVCVRSHLIRFISSNLGPVSKLFNLTFTTFFKFYVSFHPDSNWYQFLMCSSRWFISLMNNKARSYELTRGRGNLVFLSRVGKAIQKTSNLSLISPPP